MMFAGLSGNAIAYNEHGIAPRATALGRRKGADEERARNARAAKAARRALRAKPTKGPRQPPRTPPRQRTVLRALYAELTKAQATGDLRRFARLRARFELLLAQRSQRLDGAS